MKIVPSVEDFVMKPEASGRRNVKIHPSPKYDMNAIRYIDLKVLSGPYVQFRCSSGVLTPI